MNGLATLAIVLALTGVNIAVAVGTGGIVRAIDRHAAVCK